MHHVYVYVYMCMLECVCVCTNVCVCVYVCVKVIYRSYNFNDVVPVLIAVELIQDWFIDWF